MNGMEWIDLVFGAGKEAWDLTAPQMAARAALIYAVALAIVRIGKKRFMGRATAFDVIVGIILGSIASRAVTGNAPMIPTMTAAAATMLLHWAFSALAVRWSPFGTLIKGRNRILVKDGQADEDALCAAHMSSQDLAEALRGQGVDEIAAIKEARLERDGSVSVIRKPPDLRVVTIGVEQGVKTVRLELG